MKKTAIVTAIGSFSAQEVIEGCRRAGLRVVGCDIYPGSWVVNSKDVDAFRQAPYAVDRDNYKAFLIDLCHREQADYLLPLTDAEIDVLQDWPSAEEELGVTVCMSGHDAITLCRDKGKMERFLAPKAVCRLIPGIYLTELDEKTLAYPAVMKPVDGRSSQGLRVVNSPKEMELARELCGDRAEKYLVQPLVQGRIVTVDVVRNPAGGQVVCLPRRELVRTHNGAGLSVYMFRDENLEGQCRAMAELIGIRGCVNFEFIESEEDDGRGRWHFLECNPRFSGGVAFSSMAGYDMVKNHLNCFMGRPLEPMGQIREQYIARRYGEYRMDLED
ncbi:MAG: ATP-grasp domain-containing protein [Hungatella sp.]|nr:ATP-grasp domain-containing protein [Hungatella sp.]